MQDAYKESFIIIKLQKIKDRGKSIKSREAASKSSYSQSNTAPTLLNLIPSNLWEQLSTLHTDTGFAHAIKGIPCHLQHCFKKLLSLCLLKPFPFQQVTALYPWIPYFRQSLTSHTASKQGLECFQILNIKFPFFYLRYLRG